MNIATPITTARATPTTIDNRSALVKYVDEINGLARMASINYSEIESAFDYSRGRMVDARLWSFKFSETWIENLHFLALNICDRAEAIASKTDLIDDLREPEKDAGAVDAAIKSVRDAHDAWINSVGPDDDLPSGSPEAEAFGKAEETFIDAPCRTHEDVQAKLSFLLDNSRGAGCTVACALVGEESLRRLFKSMAVGAA